MKLIDILVQELPKHGGWPEGAVECCRFVDEANIDFYDASGNWPIDCGEKYGAIALKAVRKKTIPCECEKVTFEQYEAALSASQPKWNGEGLPPVGCRVEYACTHPDAGHPAIKAGKWYDGTIIAYYDECVWTSDNGIRQLSNTMFRPIRSEAERKRDEALNAMAAYCTPEDLCNAIFAGKIPHVQLK